MSAPTRQQLVDILRRPLEALPAQLELTPVGGPFDVTIRPPGSKSIMNRALLLAALAKGSGFIEHPLMEADDARLMISALRQMGATFDYSRSLDSLEVVGTAGKLSGGCGINLNNAGTATRFLTAAACLADRPVVIDGNERMRKRPIGELVSFLRQLGVRIEELGEPGCVPLRVHPHRPNGGEIEIRRTQSSQFISALMMLGPFCEDGLTLRFTSPPTSLSYIELTGNVMHVGLGHDWYWFEGSVDEGFLRLPPKPLYNFSVLELEPDASSASYVRAAGAISAGSIARTPGLGGATLQPDDQFLRVIHEVQVHNRVAPVGDTRVEVEAPDAVHGTPSLRAIDTDLSLMPDTAQTLAAVACFAEGTTTIRGLRTLRVKETDRISAIQNELAKIGVRAEAFEYENEHATRDEGIRITAPKGGVDCSDDAPHVVFDTYDDHRMAMSLALIGLRRPNVAIRDPGCVRKTYPTFWRDWSLLYESALAGGEPRGPRVE